jgi:uncharacterized protein DUF4386
MKKGNPEAIQTYARIAGVVFIVAVITGGFGEAFAPSHFVAQGDAATTAQNIAGSAFLFRLGFLGYLGEAVTDITLTFLFYVLLRPVHSNLAFLAVLFRLMATATFAFAEVFYFAPTLILSGDRYLKAFSIDQLHSLALLSLNIYGTAGNLYTVHYGIASVILGYLMYRSGYIPRALGALWVLGGASFIAGNVMWIFDLPGSAFYPLPQLIGAVGLGGWLLARGVDQPKWSAAADLVGSAGRGV